MNKRCIVFIVLFFIVILFSACGREVMKPLDDSQRLADNPENIMTYKDTSNMPVFEEVVESGELSPYQYFAIVSPIFKGCQVYLTSDENATVRNIFKPQD